MPAAEKRGAASSPRVKRSAKAVGQVMSALKNSKNQAGPTMTDIVKFISSALLKPATKRQVVTALKRGVEFGILKRNKGHYFISTPEDSFSKLTSSGSPKKAPANPGNGSSRKQQQQQDGKAQNEPGKARKRVTVRGKLPKPPKLDKLDAIKSIYRNSAFRPPTDGSSLYDPAD